MENQKKDHVETVDCTPTWAGILPIHLHLLMDGRTKPDAIKISKDELARMAKAADSYNELKKDYKEMESQAMETVQTLLKLVEQPAKALEPGAKKILMEIKQIVKEFNDAKNIQASAGQ
jgi:hypothetical protein